MSLTRLAPGPHKHGSDAEARIASLEHMSENLAQICHASGADMIDAGPSILDKAIEVTCFIPLESNIRGSLTVALAVWIVSTPPGYR